MNRRRLLKTLAALPFVSVTSLAVQPCDQPVDIHPFDLYRILRDSSLNGTVDVFVHHDGLIRIGGVLYNQTSTVKPTSAGLVTAMTLFSPSTKWRSQSVQHRHPGLRYLATIEI